MSNENPWQTASNALGTAEQTAGPAATHPSSGLYVLKDVRKTYDQSGKKVHALDGMSVTINKGELVSIQGPTGGGKSTLMQMLGALDRPTAGDVIFDGTDLSRASDSTLAEMRAKRVGFAFQSYNLIPTLTAQENVETALAPLGVGKSERRDRAAKALQAVGLGDRGAHLPAELSGGQQQRVAIARALVKDPDVILADEPTGNLDEAMRDEIMDLLVATAKARGITLVVVTHDKAVAQRLDRHLIITRGRLSA
jgi:putative ABC transport system ATP-binding protein